MSNETSVLQSRIDNAVEILKVKDLDKQSLNEKLMATLESIGVDDSEIGIKILEAETTTFEDFEKQFFNGQGIKKSKLIIPIERNTIPVPRLRAAWEVLKGNDPFKKQEIEIKQADSSIYATLRPIGQWADNELIAKYSKSGSIDIEDQLKKIAKGRPCIVFNDDGTVNEEDSLYMLRKARQHEMPDTFKIRGNVVQLFRVGEFPENIFNECPVHINKLLIDGYCDECGKIWDVNDYNRNAFIRLLSMNETLDIRLYKNMNFDELKNEFPKIFILYKQLQEVDQLPKMKKRSSKTVDGSDPFRVHRTY